jgi:hypothetical protein
MKTPPKVGTTGEQRFVVEAKHAIDFGSGGMPAVLCQRVSFISSCHLAEESARVTARTRLIRRADRFRASSQASS